MTTAVRPGSAVSDHHVEADRRLDRRVLRRGHLVRQVRRRDHWGLCHQDRHVVLALEAEPAELERLEARTTPRQTRRSELPNAQ